MQSWTKSIWLLVAALLGGATATFAQSAVSQAPARGLRVPLEHYEDGKIRTQITAGLARMQDNGNIEASDVKIEMFNRDGTVASRAEAETCFVDRATQTVTSTNAIRVTQKGSAVTGTGFEWQAAEQSFKILEQARVVFLRRESSAMWKLP